MKINSDIQKIVDSKVDKCALDAEAAATRHIFYTWTKNAGDAWYAGYAGSARRAWRHHENQF